MIHVQDNVRFRTIVEIGGGSCDNVFPAKRLQNVECQRHQLTFRIQQSQVGIVPAKVVKSVGQIPIGSQATPISTSYSVIPSSQTPVERNVNDVMSIIEKDPTTDDHVMFRKDGGSRRVKENSKKLVLTD